MMKKNNQIFKVCLSANFQALFVALLYAIDDLFQGEVRPKSFLKIYVIYLFGTLAGALWIYKAHSVVISDPFTLLFQWIRNRLKVHGNDKTR